MKILVTGCAGFIGSWVADSLVKKGHTVSGVDNLSGGSLDNYSAEYELFAVDLADADLTEGLIKKTQPEIIFHLASCAREGASAFQPLYVSQTNYQAFMNLIEPAIAHGLKQFVFTSSMAVYGNQIPPFDESLPTRPVDVYGVNKSAIEQTLQILADIHEFDYTILRPHNVMGIRQSLVDPYRNVLAIFMNRIMRGEPIYIYGDGEQKRAFSYIGDCLPAIIQSLHVKNEIINVGGVIPTSVNHIADLVCSAMGVPKTYHREYLPWRPGEVKYAYSTYAKSVRLLGYTEKIGYEEGIRRMAIWAKAKGPQEWVQEKMPLQNDKMPKTWK